MAILHPIRSAYAAFSAHASWRGGVGRVVRRCLAAVFGTLVLVLAATGADAQPRVTVTMRLAEAEWQVVRQLVLPPFEAVCDCRVRAIDVPPETLVQRLQAMQRAGRMEIDLFAQDNMRLQVYYYLYQGNWFDTAVTATLMTLPVLLLSAFLQRYLRETNFAGAAR